MLYRVWVVNFSLRRLNSLPLHLPPRVYGMPIAQPVPQTGTEGELSNQRRNTMLTDGQRRNGIPRWLAVVAVLVGATVAYPQVATENEGQNKSKPLNPFGPPLRPVPQDARRAVIELSNGKKLRGLLYLTPGLRWRFYDEKAKRYLRLPLSAIRRIDAGVRKEWMEREWRFREAASNEKVYTGRTYPVRILSYRVTLKNGRVLTGRGSAVLYFVPESKEKGGKAHVGEWHKRHKLIIQERQKGKPGETLGKLVYIKSIVFDPETERATSPHRPPASEGSAQQLVPPSVPR